MKSKYQRYAAAFEGKDTLSNTELWDALDFASASFNQAAQDRGVDAIFTGSNIREGNFVGLIRARNSVEKDQIAALLQSCVQHDFVLADSNEFMKSDGRPASLEADMHARVSANGRRYECN